MARPRAIKPTIWEDQDFTSRSIGARLTWIGMFSNADDEGYILANFKNLRRLIFGFDEGATITHLRGWMDELKAVSTIHFFEVEGEEYAHFIKWNDHQKQQKDRIQASAYPKCNKCLTDDKQMPTEVKVSKDKLSQDTFSDFWNLYPKKVEKKKSEDKWNRLSKPTQELILKDLPRRKLTESWKKGFILNPMTYFNGERWNDEIAIPASTALPLKKLCAECKKEIKSGEGYMQAKNGIIHVNCRNVLNPKVEALKAASGIGKTL